MSVSPISFALANIYAAQTPANTGTSAAMPGSRDAGRLAAAAPPAHQEGRREGLFDQVAEGLFRSMAQPGLGALGTLVNVMA
jgi:hypothetical protein